MVPQSRSVLQPLRRWDPERVGPYAIIGKLGAGAMGQVFLARSAAGRLVAVKTIRPELAEEPGFRTRFAREVAAARRVSGVFTASVIEADAEADLPWVATAYVPAPSLSTLVHQCGRLPVPAVRWLAAGCAEALQSIHRAGLLHRDVKPSNVLVAPDGPRVIDFGVARATERIELTAARGAAGTPAYMAPEQARDATRASPASDVFSLGATLVFAATGHSPYQGETVMDTLVRLATEPPDLTGVPEELMDLVTGCLQRVPRDRPTNASILAGLGPFAIPADAEHAYLPESALALISDYQHDARGLSRSSLGRSSASQDSLGRIPAGQDSRRGHGPADADDPSGPAGFDDPTSLATNGSGARVADGSGGGTGSTSGSHTALPGFEPPDAFHPGHELPGGPAGERGGLLARNRWAWAIVAGLAVGVLGVSTGAGIALSGQGKTVLNPLVADTRPVGTDATPVSSPRTSASAGQSLGPVASVPASCSATAIGRPELCVNQPSGDTYTEFVLHGSGFTPFTTVTISLVGHGSSSIHPSVDMEGTFNYVIDQGHHFFSGSIPPGTYTAVASEPGVPKAHASFEVHLPQPPPPGAGGQQPPPGSGTPPSGAPPSGAPPSGSPPGGQDAGA